MSQKRLTPNPQYLTDLPLYIYGTTQLGDGNIPFEDRVRVSRAAMKGVDWFH